MQTAALTKLLYLLLLTAHFDSFVRCGLRGGKLLWHRVTYQ